MVKDRPTRYFMPVFAFILSAIFFIFIIGVEHAAAADEPVSFLSNYPLLNTLFHILTNKTFSYFLAGVIFASLFYMFILLKSPQYFFASFSDTKTSELFNKVAIRDVQGTYHESYSQFKKKLRYSQHAFLISLIALVLKILALFGISYLLLHASNSTFAQTPTVQDQLEQAEEFQSVEGDTLELKNNHAELKLTKPNQPDGSTGGEISTPSFDETVTVPKTEDHTDLTAQINQEFLFLGANRDDHYEIKRSAMVAGSESITPQNTLTLMGTTLPAAVVLITVTSPNFDSEAFTRADYLGNWRVGMTPCELGINTIVAQTMLGTIRSDEYTFGKINCVESLSLLDETNLDEEYAEVNTSITAPTLATLAVLNTGAAIPIVGFLPYLAYLFS